MASRSFSRLPALPDVPGIGETVKGFEASVFYGVAGPKGMKVTLVRGFDRGQAFDDRLLKGLDGAPP